MAVDKIIPGSFKSISWEKPGEQYGHVLGKATNNDVWVLDYTKKGAKTTRPQCYCGIHPKYISAADAQSIIFNVISNSTRADKVKIDYYA